MSTKKALLVLINDVTEKDKTEKQLAASEKRFRALVENNYDTIALMDESFNVVYRSPSTDRVMGYAPGQNEGFEAVENVHPEDRAQAAAVLEQARQNPGKPINALVRHWHSDQRYVWMEGVVTNLLHDENVKGYVANFRDVSVRVEAEEKIAESEKRFRALLENNHDIISLMDESFNVIYRSPSSERITGWNDEEIKDLSFSKIVHPDDLAAAGEMGKELVANPGKPVNTLFRSRHKLGHYLWMEGIVTNLLHDKTIKAIVFNFRDVTERILNEKKLTSSELRFRSLIENSAEGISLLDENSNVIYRSPSGYKMLGNNPTTNTVDLAAPEDIASFREKFAESLSNPGEPVDYKVKYRHHSGRFIWAEGIFTNLLHLEGVNAVVANYHEVTARVEAEYKLVASEKRFRSLIENNNDAITLMDENFNLIYRSPAASRITGWRDDEMINVDATKNIHPDDVEEARSILTKVMANPGKHYNTLFRNLHKNGHYIWTKGVLTNCLHDESVNGIIFNYHDATVQTAAEEKLASSERRFRTLIEKNKDVIMLLDTSFKVTYRSPSATEVNGWTDEDVKDMSGIGNIHPDDNEYAGNVIKEMMANPGKSYDVIFRNRHKNGQFRWLEGAATNLLNDSDVNAILFNFRDVTERIEAAAKLKASEEQFRHSMDNMLEGVQIVGFDWRHVYVNKTLCKQTKYSKEELIGKTVMEKFPGIEQTDIYKVYQRCFNDRVSIHLENQFEFPDKSKGYFELSFQPVPEGIFILSVDITERKRAEAELISNEKRFRSLVENITDAIVLTNAETNVLYQSPSTESILGYSLEERRTLKVIDSVHPNDRSIFKSIYNKLQATPNTPIPYQYRVKHKNGNYIWLEGVVTNLLNQPEVNGYVANYRDITKRKELEERLNRAYTIARIGGWEIDVRKGTIFWSDITREIHETPMDFIPDLETGINFYKEGATRNLITQKVKEAMEQGKPWDVELQIITAKKNEKWIRSIGETEFVNGKCIRVYGSFQDIDDRKRIEQKITQLNQELEEKIELRTAQLKKSNDELEAFSYSVSHDLRAPLRAIIGYTSILQEDYGKELNEEGQRITEIIKGNTQRMGLLIDDLLAFSRLGKQELLKAKVNSLSLVNEAIETVSQHNVQPNKISWVIRDLPFVDADKSSLRQVWTNLISNAVKYAGKNATPVIEIGSLNENDQVVFYVKDNGVGFNEKYKSKLFKVFQRLHTRDEFEGTGIGLAIVHKIISRHGGRVSAESSLNKGATFYFSLPVLPE